jgi:hypothetical protein
MPSCDANSTNQKLRETVGFVPNKSFDQLNLLAGEHEGTFVHGAEISAARAVDKPAEMKLSLHTRMGKAFCTRGEGLPRLNLESARAVRAARQALSGAP